MCSQNGPEDAPYEAKSAGLLGAAIRNEFLTILYVLCLCTQETKF